ncbi:VapE domain-containing protein [Arenibacter sp. S6351L]|uniref:VapE domain-containing protein n=1 Tax=Arenibacter sp. S6351L TaxID=2926407 RepID=UPI001FF29EB4|nr:VapE domain-containing protein [Arenibacter sp. S6351L]MCK0134913.1 DUF5906 domain-containing protein [Arenibacter sp. S6351L]
MERKEEVMLQSKTVSFFLNLYQKESDINLQEVLSIIKKGSIQKELILSIRDQQATGEDYSSSKRKLASFTPCGTFKNSHKASDLSVYSKLVVLDIDKLGERKIKQVKKSAIECLYSYAVFISPSGTGLKILIKVDTDKDMHDVAFEQVKNHYESLMGVEIDQSGKDVSRLCFVSYDPELYYNPESNEFKIIDTFYADYQSAIASTKGKFKFIEGERNNYIHFLACNCNRLGIPKTVTERFVLKDYGYDKTEVLNTIKSAYMNSAELTNKEEGKKAQLEEFLRRNFNFRYNLFTSSIEYGKSAEKKFEVLNDYKLNSILRELKGNGVNTSREGLYNILNSDFTAIFHPLKDFVKDLPKWDGKTDHIGELTSRISTDDDVFFKDAFKRWFVAMVACGLHDDIVNQTAIVFSGEQGIGKSTFIRNLLPLELRSYSYSGMINPNSKDTLIQLSECLIIDMDELSNLTKKGNNELKELITKARIKVRRPYARIDENLPRRASFVGSVNDEEFLTDTTGNRRYLCFRVSKINYYGNINYKGLYSQAVALFDQGFKYYFDGEEIELLNMRNESFRQRSFIEDIVIENFQPSINNKRADHYLNSGEFLVLLKQKFGVNMDNTNNIQLGKTLNKLGFEKVKREGRRVYAIDKGGKAVMNLKIAS